MRECHLCPLNGTGSEECIACASEDQSSGRPSNKGQTVISIEELGGTVEDVIDLPGAENDIRAMYSESLREIMSMDTDLRDIIMHRMHGETYREIAHRIGRKPHSVCERIGRACVKYPAVSRMFPDRHGCHRGGRYNG